MPSWEHLKELFEGLADLSPDQRAAHLDKLCGADLSLRAELQKLLDADEKARSFMQVPAIHWTSSTIATSPAVFSFGELVAGRFRIVRFLGEGGMGQVYQAEDKILGGFVALKTIRPEIASDQRTFERFKREVRLAKEVTHDNVCRVFDLDHHNVPPFVTMELVEGETLRARLRREGRMTTEEALPVFEQMAWGLDAAHQKGILHRDFKPGNVMLTRSGSGAVRAKVTDFGLARTLGSDSTLVTGRAVGTPGYMAPELFEGATASIASDLYAFGLVLYEMVTGEQPNFQRLTDPAPTPRKQVPELDEKWEAAILRCLERDPSLRFSSTAEVVRAIQGKTSRFDPIEGWIRRHPAALVVAGIAMLLMVLAWYRISVAASPNEETLLTQVTTDSGLSTYPVISADGKWVAYASDRGGNGNLDIWLQQIGGGDPMRLTQDPSDDYDPSFSPDGTKVAFRSDRDSGGVYVVSTTGGGAQRLVRGGYGPRFSPDGKWIAYWVGSPGGGFVRGSSQIYLMPVNGGSSVIFQPEFSANFWPVWSADSRLLLFVGRQDAREGGEKTRDWWVAPINGGPARRTGALEELTDRYGLRPPVGQEWLTPATWDANGSRAVFSAALGDSTNIWDVPLSAKSGRITGRLRRRTAGTEGELHASLARQPNGSSALCYSSERLHVGVWTLPVDANSGRVVGSMKELKLGPYAASPSISADGTKLAFTGSRSGRWTLKTLNLETGKDMAHASGSSKWLRGRISRDGSKVAYVNSNDELYLADISSGASEKICNHCGPPTDLSPDGKQVLFEPLGAPENVMMIDAATRQVLDMVEHRAHPDWILYAGRFSPDGRWIAFHAAVDRSLNKKIFITPVRDGHGAGEPDWIPVTDGFLVDWHVSWSPDGNLLYFLSDRDSFRCIWAQRLDSVSKRRAGTAFAVQHFHHTQHSLARLDRGEVIGMSVARGKVVFAVGEPTGNIWLSETKTKSESWMSLFHKVSSF